MLFGPTFLFLIPAIILAIYAQSKVKNTYAKYARVQPRKKITGARVARLILDAHQLTDVPVESIPGQLTDHYDPRAKVLRLSSPVYGESSLAALGIAAHEAGHAIQHGKGYLPLMVRNGIFPLARFGSGLAFPLFFIGFFFMHSKPLMDIGILLYTGAVAFSVITLPVEFNASRRALHLLKSGLRLDEKEILGARKVLSAAALTYVAATAMAVMQLIRLLALRGRD